MMWNRKLTGVSVILLAAFLAGMPVARAQNPQQESVAEAARRAREQKKNAPKPATVVTNDTLEPAGPAQAGASATGGTSGASMAVSTTPGNQQAADSSAAPSERDASANEATNKDEFSALKQEIADKQKEVDLAQRELALANDDFYSRPDYSSDTDGKAKLDAMKSGLTQKQDELAQLKAKLPPGASGQQEKPAQDQSQPSQP